MLGTGTNMWQSICIWAVWSGVDAVVRLKGGEHEHAHDTQARQRAIIVVAVAVIIVVIITSACSPIWGMVHLGCIECGVVGVQMKMHVTHQHHASLLPIDSEEVDGHLGRSMLRWRWPPV